MPRLDNIRHESFAWNIAQGLPKCRAYANAGYTPSRPNSIHLWRHKGTTSHNIQRRVSEPVEKRINSQLKADQIRRDDILNMLLDEADLASLSGQHSAAIRAIELVGKENRLFVDRRESVNISIGNMNREQLESYVRERYGDRADSLIAWVREQVSNKDIGSSDVPRASGRGGVVVDSPTQAPILKLVTSSS